MEAVATRGRRALAPFVRGAGGTRFLLATYRADITESERDPADDALRERLKNAPPVRCETVILHGADDGVERSPLGDEAIARYFPGGARVQALAGVGHFPQREAPNEVARAILA